MEIWRGSKGRGWIKEPFASFPASEPLLLLLKEHQEKEFRTDHYLVFTKEEEEAIVKMASPFYPSHMPAHHFLEGVCRPLKEIFTNPPYVTYVPFYYEKPLGEQNEFRLAIRFNQKL